MRYNDMALKTEYDSLAQSVEHLTFNQGVRSSNLRWITKRIDKVFLVDFLYLKMNLLAKNHVYISETGFILYKEVRIWKNLKHCLKIAARKLSAL